jgi:HK97 family phage major capsid protein
MTLKERFEAAKTALAEVKSAVEAGEKSADDLQSAIAELESAQAQIKAAEEAENLIKGLEAPKDEKADKEAEENIMPKNLGENFVNYVKESGHGKKFDLAAPVFVKAATDTQTSPAGAVDFATTFDKNVVTAARTPLVVRDLFGAETISGSTLVYLVEGAIQGAPAVTAEGAEKPQIHFADPTPKTVSLAKIACHIKESDEYIDDYPFLASAINGRLIYELGLVDQNKLVTDLLATSGIQTGSITAAATYLDVADAILQAAMDVQDGSGFAADAIALNPADWFKLRTLKLTTNEYFGGGPFGAQNVPNLWGINVCVSPAVAAGTIVVGAYKTCASVVQNGGVSVEAVNTNEDDFVKNLMTIRAEERLALAVRRPAGFKKLTKAS